MWLESVSSDTLAGVFQNHAEQEDSVLWTRVAESVLAEQRRRGGRVQGVADVADIVTKAIQHLQDPAGPSPKLAVDGIRAYLRQESKELKTALGALFESLEVGSRCLVLCSRVEDATTTRHFARHNEDADTNFVRDWQHDKIAALYPLSAKPPAQQDWCVVDVSHKASGLPLTLTSKSVFILEKQLRAKSAFHSSGVLPEHDLFVKPLPGSVAFAGS
eukprot:TRINITY_DN95669_c0_g1_i1.p2 TRINITY_DN95669_c0_g1~~TRINITY_DN95669_c0_g1_i1.p2  ORF type:complete len:245 (-),score=54.50 TRINITY_DN95669_c0_g1_i1:267-917(-)